MISYGVPREMFHGRSDEHVVRKLGPTMLQLMPESHKEFLMSLKRWRKIEADGEFAWLTHNSIKRNQMMSLLQVTRTEELALDMISNSTLWPPTQHWIPGKLHEFSDGFQVFGHSPQDEAEITPHYVSLDTGCGTCFPYKLSGLVLPDMVLI